VTTGPLTLALHALARPVGLRGEVIGAVLVLGGKASVALGHLGLRLRLGPLLLLLLGELRCLGGRVCASSRWEPAFSARRSRSIRRCSCRRRPIATAATISRTTTMTITTISPVDI
jgi:hypothetical protein